MRGFGRSERAVSPHMLAGFASVHDRAGMNDQAGLQLQPGRRFFTSGCNFSENAAWRTYSCQLSRYDSMK